MRLKSMQRGGAFDVVYTPSTDVGAAQQKAAAAGGKTPAAAAADTGIEKFMDKRIEALLGAKGLSNDVKQFVNELQSDYTKYLNMPESMRNSIEGKEIASKLMGRSADLQLLANMKEMHTQAVGLMKQNKTNGDYAIDGDNFIVKYKDGSIGRVSFKDFEELKENDEEIDFSLLTNGQLMVERDQNQRLVGQTNVFDIVGSAKGLESVNETIKKATDRLGDTSILEGGMSNRVIKDAQEQVVSGTVSTYNELMQSSNKTQLTMAIGTVAQSLDRNQMSTLRAKLISNGVKYKDLDGAVTKYVTNILFPQLKETSKAKEKDGSSGKSGSGGGITGTANVGLIEGSYHMTQDVKVGEMEVNGKKMNFPQSTLTKKAYMDETNGKLELTTVNQSEKFNAIAHTDKMTTMDGKTEVDPNYTVVKSAHVAYLPCKVNKDGSYSTNADFMHKNVTFVEALSKAGIKNVSPQYMSHEQQIEFARIVEDFGYGPNEVSFQPFIVADALTARYDDQSFFGFGTSAFGDKAKKQSDEEEEIFKEAIGEKAFGRLTDMRFNPHYISTTILMPAKDKNGFREADGNTLVTAKENTEVINYSSSGNTGSKASNPITGYGALSGGSLMPTNSGGFNFASQTK